ncbi:MAG: hypothetical protein IRZ13_11420, partial [Acetobacteraceae bacterium]|nr:hypothetical protein [Acetobacteraceae bacterium]
MRTEASGVTCDDQASGAPASAFRPGSAGWGRGIAAGLLAAAVALVLVNRAALPGLHALLPPALVLPVLICGVGPAIEELCKFGAFRLLVRPARRGWRAYWAVGLTFGVLEALLKLSPLLLTAMSDGSGDEASLARLAGAATSLLLHGALGGL